MGDGVAVMQQGPESVREEYSGGFSQKIYVMHHKDGYQIHESHMSQYYQNVNKNVDVLVNQFSEGILVQWHDVEQDQNDF